MSVITARVAKIPRVITVAPPFHGQPAPAIVAAQHLAGADAIYCLGGVLCATDLLGQVEHGLTRRRAC